MPLELADNCSSQAAKESKINSESLSVLLLEEKIVVPSPWNNRMRIFWDKSMEAAEDDCSIGVLTSASLQEVSLLDAGFLLLIILFGPRVSGSKWYL